MAKKSSILILAIVAVVAFAVPSMAGAAEARCGPFQELCPVGTVVTNTGTNITLNTQNAGKLICKGLNLKSTITKNTGGVVISKTPSEEPTQIECYENEPSRPIKVTTVEVPQVEAKEATGPAGATRTETASFVIKVDLPTGQLCMFVGSKVPFEYFSGAKPAVVKSIDPAIDIFSEGVCGKAQLTGEFKLETISGTTATPVILN